MVYVRPTHVSSAAGGEPVRDATVAKVDTYVRMLLIHGARSALNAARRAAHADKPLTQLQAWALARAGEMHSNKTAVALANKLARIAWAVWHHERAFRRQSRRTCGGMS
jgi:hypothetical protein